MGLGWCRTHSFARWATNQPPTKTRNEATTEVDAEASKPRSQLRVVVVKMFACTLSNGCRCLFVVVAVAVGGAAVAGRALRSLPRCDVTGSMAKCDPDCLSCTTKL